MGDEPYAALLPFITFVVIDRTHGQGTPWAAISALITIGALLLMRSHVRAEANTLLIGLASWFGALAVVSWIVGGPTGWLARYGRPVAAAGYAVVIVGSLATRPVSEYYTRTRTRGRHHNTAEFRDLNVRLTALWGTAFALITVSSALGPWIDSRPAYTVFNWVIPLAIVAVVAHLTKVKWDQFNDDDLLDGMHEHLRYLGSPARRREQP
jgi:hypothetical protein